MMDNLNSGVSFWGAITMDKAKVVGIVLGEGFSLIEVQWMLDFFVGTIRKWCLGRIQCHP